jgi:hypothetical protein
MLDVESGDSGLTESARRCLLAPRGEMAEWLKALVC